MKKKISTESYKVTKEKEDELFHVIKSYNNEPDALIPILQKAQEIFGCVPEEVQKIVAKNLNLSLEKVYSVSTFYSQFSLSPQGKCAVSVCLGTACYVKGAAEILKKASEVLKVEPGSCSADGKFSLTACRCLGACGMAPVMKINDEVYGNLKLDEVERILEKYKSIT